MTGKLAQAAEALAVMIAKAEPVPCDYSVIWINEDDARGAGLDVDGLIGQGYARRIKAG